MDNLIEYKKEFSEDNTNESQEGSFTFGSGTSKGVEVLLKKLRVNLQVGLAIHIRKQIDF